MQTALGIDIGGTRVRVGVVSADGAILARVESPLPPDGEPDSLGRVIAEHARRVVADAGTEPVAAGVALPGVWDRQTGIMQRAVNLPKLEGVNIPQFFAHHLGRPAAIEADVNAAIWAQWHHMHPRPARFVYLSLGTGVGGGVILDGQIVRHTHGGAGHFGFLIVDTSPDAPVDGSGIRGCLSAIVAGPALHSAVTAAGEEPLSDEVVTKAARALAVAFVQLAHIYAPDMIALGGGVIDHHPEIVDRARVTFAHYRGGLIPPDLRIERAPLSTNDAGVVGAALLALQQV